MLAPVTEADFGEEGPLRVNLAGRERWPAFAAELEEVTGLPTGYRDSGALVVAADRDDAEALRRLHDFQRSLGLAAEWLAPSRCRALEPGLSPRIAGGILAPQDGHADPRATVSALAAAVEELALGVEVEAIEHDGLRGDRRAHRQPGRSPASSVVVAAGRVERRARSSGPGPAGPAGEGADPRAAHARRRCRSRSSAMLRTPRCYLVARGDGRVVLGATVEEQGFDTAVTADGVFRLLEARLGGAARGRRAGAGASARRAAAGHSRQRAGGGRGRARRARSGPPATGATACCSRRSRARSWPSLLAGEPLPEDFAVLEPGRFAESGARSTRCAHDGRDAERRARASCRPARRWPPRCARRAPEGGRGVAVALDGEVVPRGEWATTEVREGQELEVLHAVQGGASSMFEIAGRALESRLILGTGGFRNLQVMAEAARESGAELATVAMRRVDPSARGSIVEVLEEAGLEVLPNTAGCFTAREAVTTAQLAREALEHRLGEARGDRRRPHAAARPGRAARGRRGAGGATASPCCPTRTTIRSSPGGSRTRAARR